MILSVLLRKYALNLNVQFALRLDFAAVLNVDPSNVAIVAVPATTSSNKTTVIAFIETYNASRIQFMFNTAVLTDSKLSWLVRTRAALQQLEESLTQTDGNGSNNTFGGSVVVPTFELVSAAAAPTSPQIAPQQRNSPSDSDGTGGFCGGGDDDGGIAKCAGIGVGCGAAFFAIVLILYRAHKNKKTREEATATRNNLRYSLEQHHHANTVMDETGLEGMTELEDYDPEEARQILRREEVVASTERRGPSFSSSAAAVVPSLVRDTNRTQNAAINLASASTSTQKPHASYDDLAQSLL